jgi:hypothetical protein
MRWREPQDCPAFLTIARMAARQDGVVARAQLERAGVTRGAIEHRVGAGQLHRVHRGVYAVGHLRLGPRGLLWAAHLATGAAISHVSAAWAWGTLPPPALPVHVTTAGAGRSRPGVRVHRSATLRAQDVVRLDGLPVTTVARTLADLPPRLVNRATREADYRGLLDRCALEALPVAHAGRTRALAALQLVTRTPAHRTNSELEHWFLGIVDHLGLPQPLVNHRLHGRERDVFWPQLRLVVELDGRRAHARAAAMADDRRRDRDLLVRHGIRTIRFASDDGRGEVERTLRAIFG